MSNLLISEPPLQVLPSLAVKIGLNEAIILQQFHYWIQRSNNFKDGRRWIYNSYPEWNKQFPFWSKNTMIKAFKSLEKQGLIITGNYNKAGFDKTKWYSIDYSVLESLNDENGVVDDEPETGRRSTRNGFMEEPETGRPIPIDYQETTTEKNNNGEPTGNNPFEVYESVTGKQFNALQRARFVGYINVLGNELVIHAIKYAQSKNSPNFGFIDSVLKEWDKNNIKDIAAADAYQAVRQRNLEKRIQANHYRTTKSTKKEGHEDGARWD